LLASSVAPALFCVDFGPDVVVVLSAVDNKSLLWLESLLSLPTLLLTFLLLLVFPTFLAFLLSPVFLQLLAYLPLSVVPVVAGFSTVDNPLCQWSMVLLPFLGDPANDVSCAAVGLLLLFSYYCC
jgi:hypothetical protein